MRCVRTVGLLIAMFVLIAMHGTQAQNSTSASTAAQSLATTPVQALSLRAVTLLKQMSTYIGSANAFTFHADITFDHVLPSGQKLQYEAAEDVALQRPNGLYVDWSGDLGGRQFWYGGKSVTLFDPSTSFYATGIAPADIDAMLEKVMTELDFSPPLADFLYRRPFYAVESNVRFGLYLGATAVNGRQCESLAFTEKDIDWQIWIESGPRLVPCKLVIIYKAQPSEPQFSAVFTDWDFNPRIAEPIFTPSLPPDAKLIPFAPVVASASQH